MTTSEQPREICLDDYTPPRWRVLQCALDFHLEPQATVVRNRMELEARDGATELWLDGEGLELLELNLDGRPLEAARYRLEQGGLCLFDLPARCALEVVTRINPEANTALEGLYLSSGNYCTQCEAEGFRRITYYLDRPDVLTRFRTRIEADRVACPVLLSNGNLVEQGELPEGRHYAVWEDPWPKPCYLFALVAGDLAVVEDTYTTASGREVALRIFVEHHNVDRCDHAMRSLKRAMRWDEETYGLEYDLDVYMIVAVDDFNMGAMENKGLNVFNSKFVLARPDTATDEDYVNIEAVIAHEYFHNWTGNRVTCRDWFQLSLKEGLTVFRDQQFTADMTSPVVKRIDDVRMLRTHQFAEDASPMAHPVRPRCYIEINNFYTLTVYEKGAEVVRMYHTLLGPEGFRRGMDLYFERHDGQAVTTDDFRRAMSDANGVDLEQFALWYEQAGTPLVEASDSWDAESGRYTLTLRQSIPPTPGQPEKQPMLIPVRMGLIGPEGEALP
ncbi:MAG: aminopeptidase N, partial [Gammaproteobacteria bacterium]